MKTNRILNYLSNSVRSSGLLCVAIGTMLRLDPLKASDVIQYLRPLTKNRNPEIRHRAISILQELRPDEAPKFRPFLLRELYKGYITHELLYALGRSGLLPARAGFQILTFAEHIKSQHQEHWIRDSHELELPKNGRLAGKILDLIYAKRNPYGNSSIFGSSLVAGLVTYLGKVTDSSSAFYQRSVDCLTELTKANHVDSLFFPRAVGAIGTIGSDYAFARMRELFQFIAKNTFQTYERGEWHYNVWEAQEYYDVFVSGFAAMRTHRLQALEYLVKRRGGNIGNIFGADAGYGKSVLKILERFGLAAVHELPYVLACLNEPDLRENALKVIGGIGRNAKSASRVLYRFLYSNDRVISALAAITLLRIDPTSQPESIKTLIKTLPDINAIRYLGEIGSDAKAVIPRLIRILNTSDFDRRVETAICIYRIQNPARRPYDYKRLRRLFGNC